MLRKELEEFYSPEELEELERVREEVFTILHDSKKNGSPQAQEVVVDFILGKEHIYTLRNDDKLEMWIYKEGIYVPNGQTYIREIVRHVFGPFYSKYRSDMIKNKIETETYIKQEKFFKEEEEKLMPIKNGVLNLETRELLKFSPDYRFFSKVPVDYDVSAECPRIEKFLEEVLEGPEDMEIIQEVFGLCLWRDYFTEKAIFLWGEGRNGKSKLLEILRNFLGEKNCVEIPLQDFERDNFAVINIHKKLVNLSADLSSESIAFTGIFKKIVGKDWVTANRKHKERISFISYAKQLFAGNEMPMTRDLSNAFFQRWIIINFPYTFLPKEEMEKITGKERENIRLQNPRIVKDIINPKELSGLLNWSLEGLQRLRKNGEHSHSKGMEMIKKQWILKSNSFEGFLQEKLELEENSFITIKELKESYADFCITNKIKRVTPQEFNLKMREQGCEEKRNSRGRFWEGVKFKD